MRIAITVAALCLLAGCGGSSSASAKLSEVGPAAAKRLMTARLNAKHLHFRWVACVRVGRTYRHVEITRCNVNFGDPHVEGYCVLLNDGKLVTDHDELAIPCRHDDAGWDAPIVTSS